MSSISFRGFTHRLTYEQFDKAEIKKEFFKKNTKFLELHLKEEDKFYVICITYKKYILQKHQQQLIPKNCVVYHVDGDRTNFDVNNLAIKEYIGPYFTLDGGGFVIKVTYSPNAEIIKKCTLNLVEMMEEPKITKEKEDQQLHEEDLNFLKLPLIDNKSIVSVERILIMRDPINCLMCNKWFEPTKGQKTGITIQTCSKNCERRYKKKLAKAQNNLIQS